MSFLGDLQFEIEPGDRLVVRLTKHLAYMDKLGHKFTVPVGFRCDLASVPKIFRSITTPWHQSARAGVLHDCCYRWGPFWVLNRSDADKLYAWALIDDGVSRWRAHVQRLAVRLGAGGAWDRYRELHPSKKGQKPKKVEL